MFLFVIQPWTDEIKIFYENRKYTVIMEIININGIWVYKNARYVYTTNELEKILKMNDKRWSLARIRNELIPMLKEVNGRLIIVDLDETIKDIHNDIISYFSESRAIMEDITLWAV